MGVVAAILAPSSRRRRRPQVHVSWAFAAALSILGCDRELLDPTVFESEHAGDAKQDVAVSDTDTVAVTDTVTDTGPAERADAGEK